VNTISEIDYTGHLAPVNQNVCIVVIPHEDARWKIDLTAVFTKRVAEGIEYADNQPSSNFVGDVFGKICEI
jgi:hypothetical protein